MSGIIYLHHGPIRTGKTTVLSHWADTQSQLSGILTPDRGNIRWMIRLSDRKWIPFEVDGESSEGVTSVGRFHFHTEAFYLARQEIRNAVISQSPWTIVDEVGKLEVNGKGLEPAITTLLDAYRQGQYHGNIVLVVREELLEAVIKRWQIDEWTSFSAIV